MEIAFALDLPLLLYLWYPCCALRFCLTFRSWDLGMRDSLSFGRYRYWLLNTDSYLRPLKLLAYLRLLFVLPPKRKRDCLLHFRIFLWRLLYEIFLKGNISDRYSDCCWWLDIQCLEPINSVLSDQVLQCMIFHPDRASRAHSRAQTLNPLKTNTIPQTLENS